MDEVEFGQWPPCKMVKVEGVIIESNQYGDLQLYLCDGADDEDDGKHYPCGRLYSLQDNQGRWTTNFDVCQADEILHHRVIEKLKQIGKYDKKLDDFAKSYFH